jgi:hypothetical protein
MKRYTHILFIIFSILYTVNIVSGQPGNLFYSGESLTYRVSWSIFRLGTIQIKAWHDSTSSDPDLYKISMFVKSNPDIPFIEISELNETLVSASDCMSRAFSARHINDEDDVEIKCVYMEEFNQVIYDWPLAMSTRILLKKFSADSRCLIADSQKLIAKGCSPLHSLF